MPNPKRYKYGWVAVAWTMDGQSRRKFFREDHYPDGVHPSAKTAALTWLTEQRTRARRTTFDTPIPELVTAYLKDSEHSKRLSTVTTDRQRIGVYLAYCAEIHAETIGQIDVEHIRQYMRWYQAHHPFTKSDRGLRDWQVTWARYRSTASAFFTWCVEREYLKVNPVLKRKEFYPRFQEAEARWLNQDEVTKLLAWMDEHAPVMVCAFFRTLAFAGLRWSEAKTLTWERIDFGGGKHKRYGKITIAGHTKTYSNRTVPLHPVLAEQLRRLDPPHEDLIFRNAAGEPLYHQHRGWYRWIERACKDLALPPAGLHAFRHYYATQLGRSGNPKLVQKGLGHSRIQTSMIYTHVEDEDLKEAVEKIPAA